MPTARFQLGVTTAPDGRIFAVGGSTTRGFASVAEAYDTRSNTWSTVASLPKSDVFFAAVTGSDGTVYAIGGRHIYAYTALSNTWSLVATLRLGVSEMAAAAGPDGRIYVIGGDIYDRSTQKFPAVNAVQVYDPSTRAMSFAAQMTTPRAEAAAFTGPDGRIYAIGGFTGSDLNIPVNTVEAYDPRTNAWSAVASMPTARTIPAATTGPDGRIYVLGGSNGSTVLNTVEVYDTHTGSWSTAPPMPTARGGAGAATGPDHRIYAIGGLSGNVALNTVEAYTPPSPALSTSRLPRNASCGKRLTLTVHTDAAAVVTWTVQDGKSRRTSHATADAQGTAKLTMRFACKHKVRTARITVTVTEGALSVTKRLTIAVRG